MNHVLETPLRRWLALSTASMLFIAFVGGGGSQERGWGEALSQLAALPLLIMVGVLALQAPRSSRVALGVATLVAAGVAWQLLPSPSWMETAIDARAPLYEARAAAGLHGTGLRISLTPWATERGLWALLPAIAAFGAALLLPMRRKLQLSWLLVGLAASSLALGYLQLGAPQDSPLNPFPQWAPALGGVFANPNHQATALTIALVVVLSWLLGTLGDDRDGDHARGGVPLIGRRVAAGFLVVFMLVAVPLTGSRAMVLIAAGAMLAVPVTSGWLRERLFSRRRRLRLVILGSGAIMAALLFVAVSSWVRVNNELELRGSLAKAAAGMAGDAMPLGTGVGSFVPWFDVHAPQALLKHEYFNHAHNEYAQWWLESGIAGLVWIVLLAGVMMWAFPWAALRWRRARTSAVAASSQQVGRWLVGAAWVSVATLLAHNMVDYPLRTPALMTVGAWFAGVVVADALRRHDLLQLLQGRRPTHPVSGSNQE